MGDPDKKTREMSSANTEGTLFLYLCVQTAVPMALVMLREGKRMKCERPG